MWQDNELARPSTASPSRRSLGKQHMLGDTPMQSKQAEIAQEDITYHSNIPAAKAPDFYHPHEMFASPMAQPSLSSYAAEESTYTIGAGVYQAEPMAGPHGYTSQGYRLSDDAESEAPNPESLASSPRSGATTPRTASRPATPRERVQQQIALNEQKRRLRRQACSTSPMFHVSPEHDQSDLHALINCRRRAPDARKLKQSAVLSVLDVRVAFKGTHGMWCIC